MDREHELELIKALPPELILNDLSIPYREYPSQIMALAVWRDERTPSVSIRQVDGIWLWKDFGSGKGGTWIDLYMEALGWDLAESIRYLKEKFLGIYDDLEKKALVRKWKSAGKRKKESSYDVLKSNVRQVKYGKLLEYLKERGIRKIPPWLKEVSFEVVRKDTGEVKKFWGVGVQTETGSWVIRNPKMKINLRTDPEQEHSFSLIKRGRENGKLVVVEGLFDALTVEQLNRNSDYDVLILNSVVMVDRALEKGVFENYDRIVLGLDNDDAGKEAKEKLLEELTDKEVFEFVFSSKDLNEALVRGEPIRVRPVESAKPTMSPA